MEENLNNPYAAPDAILAEPLADEGTYEPKIFAIHGRIGRLRYLAYGWAVMFVAWCAVAIIAAMLSAVLGGAGALLGIALYVPAVGVSLIMVKRRLNDLDHSGWLSLLMLVPLVNFIFGLYLMFGAGTPGPNNYGLPPSKNPRLLWIVGLLLPIIAMIGILAAIALPAYQNYVTRAKAAAAQQQIQEQQQR
jgi:uncharacterized membrane protein YhaH (DUF805 family)